jgi:hypothetical protein
VIVPQASILLLERAEDLFWFGSIFQI